MFNFRSGFSPKNQLRISTVRKVQFFDLLIKKGGFDNAELNLLLWGGGPNAPPFLVG